MSGQLSAPFSLRAAMPQDFALCEHLYFEGMARFIEALGLDIGRQCDSFAHQWRLPEVRIITVAGEDAGWLQTAPADDAIVLGQLYLAKGFQRRGIGSAVIQALIAEAARAGKAMTLGVVKINPARRLYERLGFRPTHEDQYKVYMLLEPRSATPMTPPSLAVSSEFQQKARLGRWGEALLRPQ
jgi:GNAT superfamily N-acetyltransferase